MTVLSRPAVLAAAFSAFLFGPSAYAAESDFLQRFEGSWSGSGTVSRNEAENPNNVQCTMAGNASATGISMNGTCRAAVIFSRNISADIRYDPGSGRYSGTYVGSTIGPARLSGRRKGDAVVLTITWPKPVRGDTKAIMVISNPGNGQLGITVTDEIQPGGPKAQVTRLALRQG